MQFIRACTQENTLTQICALLCFALNAANEAISHQRLPAVASDTNAETQTHLAGWLAKDGICVHGVHLIKIVAVCASSHTLTHKTQTNRPDGETDGCVKMRMGGGEGYGISQVNEQSQMLNALRRIDQTVF